MDHKNIVGQNPVVLIPVGSIEQHGHHLPVLTDSMIVERVADLAVQKAAAQVPVLLMPTFCWGTSTHHIEFAGTITLKETTLIQVLTEIGLSVAHHGYGKIMFLNGHGANLAPLQVVVNQIRHETQSKVVAACASYWNFIKEEVKPIKETEDGGIAHAGEFETSAIMEIAEELVEMDRAVQFTPAWSNGYYKPGWWTPRKIGVGFHLADFTPTGTVGNPLVASKEKGKKFLDVTVDRVSEFLVAFHKFNFENMCD